MPGKFCSTTIYLTVYLCIYLLFMNRPYNDDTDKNNHHSPNCRSQLLWPWTYAMTGLLSNQGEKSMNFYFIRVPLRKKYESMVLQSPGKVFSTGCFDRDRIHSRTQSSQKGIHVHTHTHTHKNMCVYMCSINMCTYRRCGYAYAYIYICI